MDFQVQLLRNPVLLVQPEEAVLLEDLPAPNRPETDHRHLLVCAHLGFRAVFPEKTVTSPFKSTFRLRRNAPEQAERGHELQGYCRESLQAGTAEFHDQTLLDWRGRKTTIKAV